MDILIKNMEMPPHCAYDDKDGNAKLCFMFKYCLEHGYNKINNCPLVALPEHGRLIDADALKNNVADMRLEKPLRNGARQVIEIGKLFGQIIEDAPTVLEANNGTDN